MDYAIKDSKEIIYRCLAHTLDTHTQIQIHRYWSLVITIQDLTGIEFCATKNPPCCASG